MTTTTALPASWDDDVAQELSDHVRGITKDAVERFYERDEAIVVAATAILSGHHFLMLGPHGTSKTTMADYLFNAVERAKVLTFEFNPHLTVQDFVGPKDAPHYGATGQIRYLTDGYVTWADFITGDEIGKSGRIVRNLALGLLNERMVRLPGNLLSASLKSMFSPSNEEIYADTPAVDSRFLFRFPFDYIQGEDAFRRLMSEDFDPTHNTTIPLELVEWGIAHHHDIRVPPGIVDLFVKLRAQLKADAGIIVDDRKWRRCRQALQAYALYQGRDTVTPTDLPILKHVLWTSLDQRDAVVDVLTDFAGAGIKEAKRLAPAIADVEARYEACRNQPLESRFEEAAQITKAIANVELSIRDSIAQLESKQEDTSPLEALTARVQTVKRTIMTELMGLPPQDQRG